MKTIKRILAIISLILIVLVISYLMHTARQIMEENLQTEVVYEESKET